MKRRFSVMDTLVEGVRKFVLAGIGAAAFSYEKASETIEQLVKKGELTVEQGKALNEELKHNVKEAIKENVTVNVVKTEEKPVEDMTKEELDALKARIAAAEKANDGKTAAAAAEDKASDTAEPDAE